MLKKIISAFLLTGFLFTCNAQTELSKEIDKNIELRIENGVNTGIVVGIIDANGTTDFYSYGLKSMKTNEPVDKNSIFEIGSISKAFTGILLADMVLKGKMKLYDPLHKYLGTIISVF
jgi:D-alanyl-D-alanine-carboxypeptidase/D-alanyl-D-alanine-endopeptidase